MGKLPGNVRSGAGIAHQGQAVHGCDHRPDRGHRQGVPPYVRRLPLAAGRGAAGMIATKTNRLTYPTVRPPDGRWGTWADWSLSRSCRLHLFPLRGEVSERMAALLDDALDLVGGHSREQPVIDEQCQPLIAHSQAVCPFKGEVPV